MTCHAMRELMLEAEIDELEGRGTSALAAHVRECAACAAIARGIVRDTRVLAAVVARSPQSIVAISSRRRWKSSHVVLGGAAAAAIAASVLFLAQRRSDAPVTTAPAVVASAVAPVIQPAASAPARGVGGAVAPAVTPVWPQQFAAAEPVQAVPFARVAMAPAPVLPSIDDTATVIVNPPPGVRAVIMRGNNPSITVVWMY